jgi:hypothetical protein
MRETSLTTLRQFYAKNPPAHGTRLTREATSLATLRQVYAKNPSPSSPRVPHEAYQQTCSACRRNGDPSCWLCAGRGYVTGNGSAHYGIGARSAGGGARRSIVPHGGHDIAAVTDGAVLRDGSTETKLLGAVVVPDFSFEDWNDAGLRVIHGVTGNPVGRPRGDDATLTPATRRKRRSRPLVDRGAALATFDSTDWKRWAREKREREAAAGRWAEGVTNTPNKGRGLPKFGWPSLVAVGTADLTAFYEAYQAEIPTEIYEYRKGQHPSRAELSAAFARIVDKEPSWTWEPMHAAVAKLEPRDRDPAARLNHEWLVRALNWRGQPCICGHDDIIHHLAATAPGADTRGGISREYVAGVVLDGAQRAFELAMSAIARAS